MMKNIMISGVVMLILPFIGISQSSTKLLKLQSGTYEVESTKEEQLNQEELRHWPEFNGRNYGLVAVNKYPTMDEQALLDEQGVRILSFIPEAFYLVSFGANANLEALLPYEIAAYAPYQRAFKGRLEASTAPERAKNEGMLEINVHPFSDVVLDLLKADLGSHDIEVIETHETYGYVTVRIYVQQLEVLQSHPAVQSLDWKYPIGEPENYTGRTLHRTNFISPENTNGIDYTGEGVNVMLQDDGEIGPHIDHKGRVVQFWPASQGDHGDHVGGTIAGAGNLNPIHQGQAPGANLYVYKAAPQYQGFDSISTHYNSYDVVITSTSYSDGCNAGYTGRARTMDIQVFNNASLMHVFSAGNSGTSNCGYGAGNVWGNVTGGHKVGKNVITVANLNQTGGIATSSSRGPAYDGRIKPDISAKGSSVVSTINDNQYDTKSGTSMSCPGVSGTLAVLYEAYEDINGQKPKAGLMKAIVLNTADDLGNPGPDFIHGWGQINARKAYEVIESANHLTGSVTQSQSPSISINVPNDQSKARFMVYWTDPAASVNASTALINDIDLKVVDPNGDTILPLVLDHTPNATTLDDPAVPGEDHLNNVEQVEINTPIAGTYQVIVEGGQIPMGPQEYFVTYWFEPESIHVTYPVGGESITPGETELIRWDTGIEDSVMVEYSDDGGSSWITLSPGIPGIQGYIYWNVPYLTTSEVKVRLTQGTAMSTSENFSVMPVPINLEVAWSCPDSLGLAWSAVNDAISYDVYKLGTKYMDSIGSSNTIEFVDYDVAPANENIWYSVSATSTDGAVSKRAIAINKPTGVFNCELSNDLEAVSIIPDISAFSTCYGDSKSMGLVVKNLGDAPVSSFDANMYKDNSLLFTQSFSGSLAPNAIDTFYFSNQTTFSTTEATYAIVIDYSADQNRWNDTARRAISIPPSETITTIWSENFDSYSLCGTEPDCGMTDCNTLTDWVNERNGVEDDIDWRVHIGDTPSDFTGPDGDITDNGNGRYVYLEASGECNEQMASLISPCIDLINAEEPSLSFFYHMFGADIGDLHVDIFNGTEWVLDIMEPLSGPQSLDWEQEVVDLSDHVGQMVNIRFRGITANGYRGDIALDSIEISHPPLAKFSHIPQKDGFTVTFTDLSAFGEEMSFDLGDGTELDSVPNAYTYSNQVTYTVTQIVSNRIGSDTFSVNIQNLGNTDPSMSEVELYPNPTDRNATLLLPRDSEFELVQILSMDGKLLYTEKVKGRQKLILRTNDFAKGVYAVRLLGQTKRDMRLVIQ